ncbi:MAG: hypothetical protein KFKLKKLM_01144 [Flavobacteriales bacterium]|nr:hypothetical protein [Flavobacteriales bacterium]
MIKHIRFRQLFRVIYSGNSAVIDPKGNAISNITTHQNHIQTIELSLQELEDFREKFPVGLDGDDFEIQLKIYLK